MDTPWGEISFAGPGSIINASTVLIKLFQKGLYQGELLAKYNY